MKKINLLMIALVGALTLTLTSCDDCKDVDCGNGTCMEGTCDCPDGFSGDACEVEDKCVSMNVTCENGGTCDDGVCECADNFYGDSCTVECVNGTFEDGACTCDAGYEGDACTIESRADMIAKYSAADACSASGAATYDVEISASSTSADAILLSNFWDVFDADVVATVDGDAITIASQDPDSDGYKVSGSGTYTDGKISFSYSITDPDNDVDACTSTWTKK